MIKVTKFNAEIESIIYVFSNRDDSEFRQTHRQIIAFNNIPGYPEV